MSAVRAAVLVLRRIAPPTGSSTTSPADHSRGRQGGACVQRETGKKKEAQMASQGSTGRGGGEEMK